MSKVERKVAILGVLSQATEPTRPSDIGEVVGETALNTGRYLTDMAKSNLVNKPDKKKTFYEITEKGRGYLENPPEEVEGEELERSTEDMTEDTTKVITETVPSQADLFRGIGERLGVGARKGDVRLDAIIYYAERTADLDNLNSVWNALTEMGVALPNKSIPDELKEKLESGQEVEKVKIEEKGEIPPKPKRFSIIAGQITGDPEGDYSFKEALLTG